jgi:ElaB/YqjD/DUF883 family membrane-anchored ribosome-binding protein
MASGPEAENVIGTSLTNIKLGAIPEITIESFPTPYSGALIMDTDYQAVTREKLATDMRILLADTEQLLKAVIGQSGERLAALQPRIEENLRKTKAQLAEFEQAARDRANATVKLTDDYAHEHPWRIAATSALVGMALGLLIGRR